MRAFNLPYLKWFKEQGFEVHVAFENRFGYDIPNCDRVLDLPFKRNPLHPANYIVYKKLKRQMELEQYDLVHCHTPVPAAVTRLAARGMRKKGTRVLYTAHGFHFYKGAPLKNWLIYYSAEKILSGMTDGIVTINKDDYEMSKQHFSSAKSYYISGVGVDVNKYDAPEQHYIAECRHQLGIGAEDFVLLYTAEFIPRKNHQFILNTLPALIKIIPQLKVLFAGRGRLMTGMQQQVIELGLSEHVVFLGFRQDLEVVQPAADVCISVSRQEGLGLGLAEGMMCAKPIVASKIRGHADLVSHGQNGYLFDLDEPIRFMEHIVSIYKDDELRKRLGINAWSSIQEFSIPRSLQKMEKIYNELLYSNNLKEEEVI